MGEVYRARDTRLGREIAIKVLPAALATDPVALARFEREAQAVASLSHPNIVALYEFGRDSDRAFAVMELLDGESLRAVLARGALPVRKAVEYTVAITRGLSAAHARGVVHRDLKPENVFLTRDGQIKILDFGLAHIAANPAWSGTIAATVATPTSAGAVLGTVGYMAPEQVRGSTVDHRADLFALGVILYEMVSGKRAFACDTTPETLTAILKADPPPLDIVAPELPPSLGRIVTLCLEKRPEDRFESARDVGLALETIVMSSGAASQVIGRASRTTRWSRAIGMTAGAALIAMLAGFAGWRLAPRNTSGAAVQFTISVPTGDPLSVPPMISPDGRYVAFVVADGALGTEVWVRAIDSVVPRALPGTAMTYWSNFLWSPDSRFIAFGTRQLMKVPTDGGPVQPFISELLFLGDGGGVSWSAEGDVLLPRESGMWRSSASGAPAVQATHIDAAAGETLHAWPQFLPDGRHFLYHSRNADASKSAEYVASLDGGVPRLLLRNAVSAVYADPGYILFSQAGRLVAQRFDPQRLAVVGEPRPLGLDALSDAGNLYVSTSRSGTLVTAAARNTSAVLAWVDRHGVVLHQFPQPGRYHDLALSPDGSRLALNQNAEGGQQDIWTMDVERGALTRRTSSPKNEWVASWSPDGRTLAFTIDSDLYTIPADGSRAPTLLRKNVAFTWVTDWSPDGRFLICQQLTQQSAWDIVAIGVDDPHTVTPIAQTDFMEVQPRISADGRWIVYTSDESGRSEIYMQPFPSGGKTRVSIDGGSNPRWRRDGRELYYMSRDGSLMAVDIDIAHNPPTVGQPHALFRTNHPSRSYAGSDYVPSLDGQRFLLTMPAVASAAPSLIVTLNWTELLRSR